MISRSREPAWWIGPDAFDGSIPREATMRYSILGAVLAAGLALATARPADAQVMINLGGNGVSPGVMVGQAYVNNSAYRPAYGTAYPGTYAAPAHRYAYPANYYNSGYRGVYGPAPSYRTSGYYTPGTPAGYASPYYGMNRGVYVNAPVVGTYRIR